MIKLDELAKILEANENLSVEITEKGVLISEKQEQNESNVPSDLANFVGIYEKQEIIPTNDGFEINVTSMSGPNFAKLLNSVFSETYEFTLEGEYKIIAREVSRDAKSVGSYSFESIAQAIDSDDIEIEIHEDGLKVVAGSNKLEIAEKIDSMGQNLDIQILDEYILVSEA